MADTVITQAFNNDDECRASALLYMHWAQGAAHVAQKHNEQRNGGGEIQTGEVPDNSKMLQKYIISWTNYIKYNSLCAPPPPPPLLPTPNI